MKRKIIAIIASVMIFSGAGVYAANKSGAEAKPAPTTAAVTVKNTKTSASAGPSAAKASVPSSPASKAAAAVREQGSSCPASNAHAAVQKTAAPVSQQKSSCSSTPAARASSKAASRAATSCAGNSGCANVPNQCPNLSQSGQCAGSDCYQDILNRLMNKNCGQSAPASSKPASSIPSSSSKPASSSQTGSASGSYASFQNEVVRLVNQERTSRGLKALTVDSALTNTATLKSQDMAKLGYFDHTSPTYGTPFDMMKQFGITYRAAGENIAYGQTSPSQVMQGWMNSEGHRANILSSSYTKIGVGIAQNSSGRYYWTQQFIG